VNRLRKVSIPDFKREQIKAELMKKAEREIDRRAPHTDVADRVSSPSRPSRLALVGVALISMALLALEITLTRVFSVKMWYHFAFMSISLALLGGAVGGMVVYVGRERLGRPRLNIRWLAWQLCLPRRSLSA